MLDRVSTKPKQTRARRTPPPMPLFAAPEISFEVAYADFCEAVAGFEPIDHKRRFIVHESDYAVELRRRGEAFMRLMDTQTSTGQELRAKLHAACQISAFIDKGYIDLGAVHTAMLMALCADADRFEFVQRWQP